MGDKQEINYNNVMLIAQYLLELDISDFCVQNNVTLAIEFELLQKYRHNHRYASAEKPPDDFSTFEWIEHVEKQFIEQTRRCVNKLTDDAQTQLFKFVKLCHQWDEL